MPRTSFLVRPDAVREIMRARGVTASQLFSHRADRERVKDLESKETPISKTFLLALSKKLNVAPFLFLSPDPLRYLQQITDFRSKEPTTAHVRLTTLKKIDNGRALAHALSAIRDSGALDLEFRDIPTPTAQTSPQQLAAQLRRALELSDDLQLSSNSTLELLRNLRERLTQFGIFSIVRGWERKDGRGVALAETPPISVLLINAKDELPEAQLFSLAHELCHVLVRKSGVSDYEVLSNEIEVYCNQFAGFFLAPVSLIEAGLGRLGLDLSSDASAASRYSALRDLASYVHVSQAALAIQLEKLEFVENGFTDVWRRWLREQNIQPPQVFRRRARDPEKPIINRYGERLCEILLNARERGLTDDHEIFGLIGSKPDRLPFLARLVSGTGSISERA